MNEPTEVLDIAMLNEVKRLAREMHYPIPRPVQVHHHDGVVVAVHSDGSLIFMMSEEGWRQLSGYIPREAAAPFPKPGRGRCWRPPVARARWER